MLVTNGVLRHAYAEVVHEGMRLGRHLALDARSLAYTIEADVETMALAPKPHEWPSPLPVLDQGQLGSCTGNAGTYAASAGKGLGLSLHGFGLSSSDPDRDEAFAVELYHEATVDDGFPGEYPPDDTGSSGLGVCRALKAAGLISGYRWATSLHGFVALLQKRGVMAGWPWLEEFFDPAPDGFIDSGDLSSPVAGGHEFYVCGLVAYSPDPAKCIFEAENSWSEGWGDHGRFRFRGTTYQALKQQVDLKQLVA